jgi:uncharacterized DUF497 family protein
VVYEWDAAKAARNLKKRRVPFEEAAPVFLDPFAVTFSDPDHSGAENREITVGHTMKERLVFVAHCEREKRIRLISARLATKAERKQYEKDWE